MTDGGKSLHGQIKFLIVALVLSSWPGMLFGQSRESIEAAKKEGEFVFYSGIPVPDAQAMLAALEKKHPFLKTTFTELPGRRSSRAYRPNSVPGRIFGMP
jgi:hypothetical protein